MKYPKTMNNLLITILVCFFYCTQLVAQTAKAETSSKNTNEIIEDLKKLANQFGSESEAFLDYWQIHYPLMSDTAAIEKIWQFLIKTRIKEFGENSNSHISALFGLSSFYKRCGKVAEYQELRKQVEVYWKIQVVEKTEEEIEKERIEAENENEICYCDCREETPRFPGCEAREGDYNAKKNCSDQKLLKFIYNTIRYPKEAREKRIEGMAVVSFTVTEYGTVTSVEIVRSIGGGCDEEALRIINLMNELPIRWVPGFYRDKIARVKRNLPVRFKLN